MRIMLFFYEEREQLRYNSNMYMDLNKTDHEMCWHSNEGETIAHQPVKDIHPKPRNQDPSFLWIHEWILCTSRYNLSLFRSYSRPMTGSGTNTKYFSQRNILESADPWRNIEIVRKIN